jgi:hypothetical protein
MNGVVIEATAEQLSKVLSLSFVKGLEGTEPLRNYASILSAARRVSKFAMEDTQPQQVTAYPKLKTLCSA